MFLTSPVLAVTLALNLIVRVSFSSASVAIRAPSSYLASMSLLALSPSSVVVVLIESSTSSKPSGILSSILRFLRIASLVVCLTLIMYSTVSPYSTWFSSFISFSSLVTVFSTVASGITDFTSASSSVSSGTFSAVAFTLLIRESLLVPLATVAL